MPLVGHVFTADDGRVWDLDAGTRTDPDASVHPESEWADAEKAIVASWRAQAALQDAFQSVRTLIGSVDLITATAEEDITDADTKQGQIEAWQATVTARAAAIRGIPTPTVAQIKEELALACERDVRIAQELDGFYQWRSIVDQLLELLAQCVAGLARYVTKTTSV